jgi:hypothetical protein
MNIPTRSLGPVQKGTAGIFCLESGETFGGIFEEPLSFLRQVVDSVFRMIFFLFIARLLGIFELFFIKLLRQVGFYLNMSLIVRGQFSNSGP